MNNFLSNFFGKVTLSNAGLVEGGFDRLGYTPVKEALQRCEGKARYRVMGELNRYMLGHISYLERISVCSVSNTQIQRISY